MKYTINWKEFLKPTISKMILTLFLLFLFTLIFGIPVKKFPFCEPCPPPETGLECKPCPLIIEFYGINQLIDSKEFIGRGIWLPWHIYLAELIIVYLTSSLAMYFLNLKSQT